VSTKRVPAAATKLTQPPEERGYIVGQFVQNAAASSRLIEWFGGGGFSHVDAVLPNGALLGARSDAIGGQDPGVRIRPPGYEAWPRLIIMRKEVPASQARAWERFLAAQVGAPYDKRGIWDFVTGGNLTDSGRDWRDPSAWFCSELWVRSLEVAGVIPLLPLSPNRITPGTAACIAGAAGFQVIKRAGYPEELTVTAAA